MENETKNSDVAEAKQEKNPHDLVKLEDVKKVLAIDQGDVATLESFFVKDFTSKGDNYACLVSSVVVKYSLEGKQFDTTYIVKLNPGSGGTFVAMVEPMFYKEIGFYEQILPLINQELSALNEKKLRVPRYFHSVSEKSGEVIYMEDLRKFGYKMVDRQKGMDKDHTFLILKELARLHAASALLFSREEYNGVNINEKLPVLVDLMEIMRGGTSKMSDEATADMINGMVENNASIVDGIEGYEYVAEFLRNKKGSKVMQMYLDMFVPKEPFIMLNHGDCWNNNFLFRLVPETKSIIIDLYHKDIYSGIVQLL